MVTFVVRTEENINIEAEFILLSNDILFNLLRVREKDILFNLYGNISV
jgi:hypothetical protein